MQPHATSRSTVISYYFKFKAVTWLLVGAGLWWASTTSPEMGVQLTVRLFAFFLLLFAVPALLLWILSTPVKYRSPFGWWFGLAYLILIVTTKMSLGFSEAPADLWQRLAHQPSKPFLAGIAAIGLLSVVVFALDLAALVAFLSPKGRDCWGVGKRNPQARI
jgi:hypothetical protein